MKLKKLYLAMATATLLTTGIVGVGLNTALALDYSDGSVGVNSSFNTSLTIPSVMQLSDATIIPAVTASAKDLASAPVVLGETRFCVFSNLNTPVTLDISSDNLGANSGVFFLLGPNGTQLTYSLTITGATNQYSQTLMLNNNASLIATSEVTPTLSTSGSDAPELVGDLPCSIAGASDNIHIVAIADQVSSSMVPAGAYSDHVTITLQAGGSRATGGSTGPAHL